MQLPLLIEPAELAAHLSTSGNSHSTIRIIDLCSAENYSRMHISGAINLAYNKLICGVSPAPGLMPSVTTLEQTLRDIGLSNHHWIIAYDDQANGRACRLLWTLQALNHTKISLLNGGLTAWYNEGHAVVSSVAAPKNQTTSPHIPGNFTAELNNQVIADKQYIRAALVDGHIADEKIVLLDARSPAEYNGQKSPSARFGRIPHARNLNWIDTIDSRRNLRFKPPEYMHKTLAKIGITQNQEIITYCQSHMRSAHTFILLHSLGFPKLRGYPGSWAEWSADPTLPIESCR